MMHSLERGTPVAEAISGYSCQAPISLNTARTINAGRIRVWFCTNFNASENPPQSNPIRIFEELDLADKLRTHNEKSSDVLKSLLRWCEESWERGEISDKTYTLALINVHEALENGGFSPIVMYLDRAVGAEKMNHPDEYILPDAMIGGPLLRQVLPPEEAAPDLPGTTQGAQG